MNNDLDDDVIDKAYRGAERGERNSGGGKSSRKGRGAGGASTSSSHRETQISKALSRLLRHQAANANIPLDGEGYAPLDRVLAWQGLRTLQATWADIQTAVNDNSKQRFAIKPAGEDTDIDSKDPVDWLIRANQGHSIKLESGGLLKPLQLDGPDPIPSIVVHGTFCAFWPAILESGGLKPMGRNHVHFATALPEDIGASVVSGMRNDAELLVYVDAESSLKDGAMEWWLSDNGVVLTEGGKDGLVPTKYFTRVVGRGPGIGTLWENGEWVADLPAGVKWRTPYGKHRKGNRG